MRTVIIPEVGDRIKLNQLGAEGTGWDTETVFLIEADTTNRVFSPDLPRWAASTGVPKRFITVYSDEIKEVVE